MSPHSSHVQAIATTLKRLSPGEMATLRRMSADGSGTPAFWRLAARISLPQDHIALWQRIVRIMALLSAKGAPEGRSSVHDPARPLGAVLCDGGDATWQPGPTPRPAVSEARLARFLALPAFDRGDALERLARALGPCALNCADIADLLLSPADDPRPIQRLARSYYNRLDRAQRGDADQDPAHDDTFVDAQGAA